VSVRVRGDSRLGGPIVGSVLLHGAAFAAILATRPPPEPPRPPVYKVNIVAAPPGPRQAGVVTPPAAEPEPPRPAEPPPTRAEQNPRQMPAPVARPQPARRQPPAPATPNPRPEERQPRAEDAPRAGGGPTGGAGTDVATVRTEGIEFPHQGYLNNIVRQIAMRFKPENPNSPLRAEVFFLIRRDGSIDAISLRTRSGNYAFDLDALGAVEAAGNAGAFGPLPEAYQQDVLPVIFSFDPRLIQ
jgi:protein TonB